MALKIGDVVTNDPVRDDIVRAIDLGPRSIGWRLALDNGEDDHIEVIAAADGGFKMTFVDRGRRLEAEAPIDAENLKSVLIKYLDGDTDWRDEVRLIDASSRAAASDAPPGASAPNRQSGRSASSPLPSSARRSSSISRRRSDRPAHAFCRLHGLSVARSA